MGRVVLVTSISPTGTVDQLYTLFSCIGSIEEVVLFPKDDKKDQFSKVCYVRFKDCESAGVALHLNNTVFLDRALIVLPLGDHVENLPEEDYSCLLRAPPFTSAGILPRSAQWPMDVVSLVVGRTGDQVVHTLEPRLSTLGLPPYPALPTTTEAAKIEQIRRTVLVTNLSSETKPEELMAFFNVKAEVRCLRMAGTSSDVSAYVEFTEQPGVILAFSLQNSTIDGRKIVIQHSTTSIVKAVSNLGYKDEYRSKSPRSSHRSQSRSSRRRRSSSRHRTSRRRSRSRHRSSKKKSSGRKRSRSRRRHKSRDTSRRRRRHRSSSRTRRRSKERRNSRRRHKDRSDRRREHRKRDKRRNSRSSSRRRRAAKKTSPKAVKRASSVSSVHSSSSSSASVSPVKRVKTASPGSDGKSRRSSSSSSANHNANANVEDTTKASMPPPTNGKSHSHGSLQLNGDQSTDSDV